MRYLLPLLFIFGCEPVDEVKLNQKNEGSCVIYEDSIDRFTCYENYSVAECLYWDGRKIPTGELPNYNWIGISCEEFCEDVSWNNRISNWDWKKSSCLIND